MQGIWDEITKGETMSTSMKDLLEAGVHFGHQTQRWNPKMDKYIYSAKSGIHILDLRITYEAIEKSQDYIQKLVANSGKVLFVGTKPQAQQVIEDQAIRADMPYVNFRWLGGMLTNFKTIIKRVTYLKELMALESSGEINAYTKSERLKIRREIEKLNKSIMNNKKNVEENLVSMIAKIGEKITLGRSKTINSKNSKNFFYKHSVVKDNLSKLAVIVSLSANEKSAFQS